MGFFCFIILKFVLKNISNSFYKGIGGYFEIILPLNPQLDPPKRLLFFREYHLLPQALLLLIIKTLLAFFRFYFSCKTYFFKTLILALIKSWFKAFLIFSNWRFLFLRLAISLSKSLKMLAIAICSFRGGKRISKSFKVAITI